MTNEEVFGGINNLKLGENTLLTTYSVGSYVEQSLYVVRVVGGLLYQTVTISPITHTVEGTTSVFVPYSKFNDKE